MWRSLGNVQGPGSIPAEFVVKRRFGRKPGMAFVLSWCVEQVLLVAVAYRVDTCTPRGRIPHLDHRSGAGGDHCNGGK